MLNRISLLMDGVGFNRIIKKSFQRNLQQIEVKVAYCKDNPNPYYKEWTIKEFNESIKKWSKVYSSDGKELSKISNKLDINA